MEFHPESQFVRSFSRLSERNVSFFQSSTRLGYHVWLIKFLRGVGAFEASEVYKGEEGLPFLKGRQAEKLPGN